MLIAWAEDRWHNGGCMEWCLAFTRASITASPPQTSPGVSEHTPPKNVSHVPAYPTTPFLPSCIPVHVWPGDGLWPAWFFQPCICFHIGCLQTVLLSLDSPPLFFIVTMALLQAS